MFESQNPEKREAPINIIPFKDSDADDGLAPEYCRQAPKLTVLSLSLKTVMNYKKNINEIVVASGMVYHQGKPPLNNDLFVQ